MKALNKKMDVDNGINVERGVDCLVAVTLCPTVDKFGALQCINRECSKCGVHRLQSQLSKLITEKVRKPSLGTSGKRFQQRKGQQVGLRR